VFRYYLFTEHYIAPLQGNLLKDSDVAFPEKYVTENFQEIFRKISGNFLLNRKNVFIHVSMKTAENTGKLLHSFKS